MRRAEIPSVYQQALALFEAFRRFGFSAEDIYVASDSAGVLAVLLKTQGQQFVAPVGHVDLNDWEASWTAVVEALRSGALSDADLEEIWQESLVRKHGPELLLALYKKGIRVPKLNAFSN